MNLSSNVACNMIIVPARFLTVVFSLLLLSFSVSAQDYENEEQEIYKRPSHRVYKSLAEAMAQPDSVFILELKGKKLTSIPEQVYNLPNLKVLDLSKNRIREIPSSVGKLHSLEELILANNKIDSLPDEIGSLVNLKKLGLNRNLIRSLPVTIGQMQSLQILELWDNELQSLPAEMRDLRQLRILELRGILFSDEQQDQFRELLPDVRIYMSPACDCKTN